MRHRMITFSALLLAACGSSDIKPGNQVPASVNASASRSERPARQPFAVDEEVDGLSFSYGWPAEADAVPALRALLHAEMERERAEALGFAREGQRLAAEQDSEFRGHYYSRSWTVAGNNAQLLSLSAQQETYEGGAHGNRAFHALIWDRAANAPVRAADLLGAPALAALQPRFCAALDAERRSRRGGESTGPEPGAVDEFDACPNLAQVVLSPTDDDGNRRFERIMVLLPPYAVGAYAEGDYVIDLPLHAADIARLPERIRAVFEPGRSLPPRPVEEDRP